jgi:hypothetical protein
VPGGGATRAQARLHARVHGHRCYCVVRAPPTDTVSDGVDDYHLHRIMTLETNVLRYGLVLLTINY